MNPATLQVSIKREEKDRQNLQQMKILKNTENKDTKGKKTVT